MSLYGIMEIFFPIYQYDPHHLSSILALCPAVWFSPLRGMANTREDRSGLCSLRRMDDKIDPDLAGCCAVPDEKYENMCIGTGLPGLEKQITRSMQEGTFLIRATKESIEYTSSPCGVRPDRFLAGKIEMQERSSLRDHTVQVTVDREGGKRSRLSEKKFMNGPLQEEVWLRDAG
jgi:hypothetical protein